MLRYTCHALFIGSLVLLSGCDNSSSSSTSGSPGSPGNPGNPGTPGTPDPQDVVVRLPDVAVPGEAVQASARQAVIHLVDIAGITSSTPADYATKNLYLWNNETCDALSAPVASELGWHLVWCEAIRPAAPMTPEQALESARDYLSQQSQRRHQRQWLAEMLARQPGLCG